MFKKLLFILIGIAILGFFGYTYIYKEHRNIAEEEAEFVLDAELLVKNFSENPEFANENYLNKTIAVEGKITAINDNNLILDNRIFCEFSKFPENIKLQEMLIIKGRCIGYDDLLGEVKLDQCSVTE